MEKIVIANPVRTAIGNFGGALRTLPAYDLAALVLSEATGRSNLKSDALDMVIMGQNYQSGEYVNIARMALLKAGFAVEIPALTLDRRCPSGLDAICLAAMSIQSQNAEVVLAGGVESMSTAEFYLPGEMRWSVGGSGDMPRGHGSLASWSLPLYDRILRARVMSQPQERFGLLPTMMTWAESAAKEHSLTREEVDLWALASNQKACAAITSGRFKAEIVPVAVPQARGEPVLFCVDERPRADSTLEALARLRAVIGGVCTAGNSSGENDGAAACLVLSADKARKLKIEPLGTLKSFAFSGVDPRFAWKAVPAAVEKALSKAGLTLGEIDLIEIHEAFAAQALANFKELKLAQSDLSRVNVNGSCVALGHPLGATGARILTTLLHEMQRRKAHYGLVAICGGGGMGACAILEIAQEVAA
jgi:acetyl-CoA C-acetyltransferase